MHYSGIKKTKSREIILLEDKIKSEIQHKTTAIQDTVEHFLFKDAKRLRPLYIFLVCDILKIDIDDEIINFAAGVELLHSASLIHDDILDEGQTRRGAPCLHIKKDVKTAVLAGDYLLSLAMDLLAKTPRGLSSLAEASYLMTKGEISSLEKTDKIDFSLFFDKQKRSEVISDVRKKCSEKIKSAFIKKEDKKKDIEEYLAYVKDKTSALFLASIEGLYEIKGIQKDYNILKFTEDFSVCFQMRDDINEFCSAETNKSSSKKSEIKSLPYIFENKEDSIEYLKNYAEKTKKYLSKYENKEKLIELTDCFTNIKEKTKRDKFFQKMRILCKTPMHYLKTFISKTIRYFKTKNKKEVLTDFAKSLFFDVGGTVLFVIVAVVLIRFFVGELRWIPSSSMHPTLLEGDRIFVEKIKNSQGVYKRGDVIVFYPPDEVLKKDFLSVMARLTGIFCKDIAYIKRIIGMPGDEFEIKKENGEFYVYINGEKQDEPYILSKTDWINCRDDMYCGPFVVPKDSYFMMGDNRGNSQDSRFWGFLPKENIIGHAVFRFWPLNRAGLIPYKKINPLVFDWKKVIIKIYTF